MKRKNIIRLLVLLAFHFPLLPGEGLGVRLQAQYKVVHLEKPFNTTGSETGALVVGDTVMVYSSMQEGGSRNKQFNLGGGVMQVYQARIARNGKMARPKADRWGINSKREHTGNVALDPFTHDLYFTRGDIESLHCEIFFAKRKKRRGWEKPVKLKGPVNSQDYTSTHPAVGRLADSTVILYFVSDRPGGLGGTDIWYTLIKNGRSTECVNLGPLVNSPDDEYTPFYDQRNGVLYFSSNRPGGKGGHDIYCAAGQRNTWQKAEPVCGCLNSEENDLYFTICSHDTLTGRPLSGFLASNRRDSYFSVDTACCNDLYRWNIDSSEFGIQHTEIAVTTDTNSSEFQTPDSEIHFMFPLFLYFHNDEPDPQSRETATATAYPECQRRYAALRGEYIAHQQNADDSAMMALFFDTCVVGNFNHVEELLDYVESLLDDGHSVTINIAGFASPVYQNDYNLNLSHRRIGTFINMIRAWRGGVFDNALDSGHLRVDQRPHGAVSPTTASQSTDPVYGLPAALARRIEILSCEVR